MDTVALSHKTELEDRTLWYDGDSTVKESNILEMLLSDMPVEGLCVDVVSPEIEQFNSIAPPWEKIEVKSKVKPADFNWVIPDEYKELNLEEVILTKLDEESKRRGWEVDVSPEYITRYKRILEELPRFERAGATPMLRALLYVINTLYAQGVPWGIGRGSSVSSYVLYLVGVHDVDSVKYDLDIADFLRFE